MAPIHHLGLYREPSTKSPVEYYSKLPRICAADVGFVLDPMVATAGTAIAAINILKEWGLKKVVLVCVIASRAGYDTIRKAHPEGNE